MDSELARDTRCLSEAAEAIAIDRREVPPGGVRAFRSRVVARLRQQATRMPYNFVEKELERLAGEIENWGCE